MLLETRTKWTQYRKNEEDPKFDPPILHTPSSPLKTVFHWLEILGFLKLFGTCDNRVRSVTLLWNIRFSLCFNQTLFWNI